MTVAKAPAPEEAPASRARFLGRAARSGFVAWLPLALGGQLVAGTAYGATRAFGPWSWVKVGVANTLAAARVPFEARAEAPDPIAAGGALVGMTSIRVTVALGAGTVVMLVLLFRAGRDAVRTVPWRPGVAIAASLAVALGFAVPMVLSATLVTLRFPSIGIGVLRPVMGAAFVLPFAIGCSVAGVGAIAAGRTRLERDIHGRRGVAAARGAWHGMVWGIVLALLGSVALAAVRPAGTIGYVRALERQGPGGAVLAMYHALLLPNQAVDVLAIGMGSCTSFTFSEGSSHLCLGGHEIGDPVTALVVGEPASGPSRGVAAGRGSLAFLLVPAFASIAGGRRAAEGVRAVPERAIRAASAGVAFGLLSGVAAWAATLTVERMDGPIASLGADPIATAALATVWGVAGGVLGALAPQPVRAGADEVRAQDPEEFPSETSLK